MRRTEFYADLDRQAVAMRAQGMFKEETVLATAQGPEIEASDRYGRHSFINFCTNDYLGLAGHPAVRTAVADAANLSGAGMASVRFICGTHTRHIALENEISQLLKREDTILFPSCFDANTGFFETFFDDNDCIISDRLNHASIIDGIRLSKARRFVYANCDLVALETHLAATQEARRVVIVTDGVFSMDGVVAPLPAIAALAERYKALVYVDDSHGIGVLGKSGGGAVELHGLEARVDFVAGTLGKALGGGAGGFISGHRSAIAHLRQRARPYLFSNSIAPPLAAGASAAIEIMRKEPARLVQLLANAARLREDLEALGFTVLGGGSAILPVLIGSEIAAREITRDLAEQGIHVVAFSYPVVPKGEARIRIQVSAAHEASHLDRLVEAFANLPKRVEEGP